MFKLLKSYFRKLFLGLLGGGQKIFRITFSRVYTLYEILPLATSKEENQRVRVVDLLISIQNNFIDENVEQTVFEQSGSTIKKEINFNIESLASNFKRFINLFIDSFVILFLYFITTFSIIVLFEKFNLLHEEIFFYKTLLLIYVIYYIFCELVLKNTLSKYLTNTKTIFLPSKEILIWRIIKRTFIRLIPILYFFKIDKRFQHDHFANVKIINIETRDRKKYRNIRITIICFFAGIISLFVLYILFDPIPENETISESVYLDSDNDNIVDSLDICPEKYGLAKNNGCPNFESVTFENKNQYKLNFVIAFLDVDKNDYQIDGHYEIKPFESFEYTLPKNYSYDKIYLRAFLEDENGTPFVWWGDESEYEFSYSKDNILETYNSISTFPKKGYEEFELYDKNSEFALFLE